MLPVLLPPLPGVGFKPDYFAAIRRDVAGIGFFEVHAENYLGAGGLPHAQLTAIRADHVLSIHGVGLSIGGARGLDRDHLARVKLLCDRYRVLDVILARLIDLPFMRCSCQPQRF